MTTRNLKYFFEPASVALVGASRRPSSVGNVLMRNLVMGGFEGPVLPVNPKAGAVLSTLAYPDVASLPETPELAVICTPPDSVPGLIDELGQRGTKAAVVITAGFGELGAEGKALQKRALEAAKPHLLRIVGPNCVGVLSTGAKLNASFAHRPALPGDLAFISQSGAMVTTVLDWASSRGIGFSHMVSLGDMADVDFGDMLDYLVSDPGTRAILLYIESVTEARKFMSAARAAARVKPVIVIKSGRHSEGAKAAASHTGALAGADHVYLAAFRRAGMLRVLSLHELFEAVETLALRMDRKQWSGDRVAILTNGGGVGVMATDSVIDEGARLAELGEETIEELNNVLPRTWSGSNPVDIIGDAPGSRYKAALEPLLKDRAVDALAVLNCPTAVADSLEAAEAVIETSKGSRKPVFTCWLGDDGAGEARKSFASAGLPSFETPADTVRAFMHILRYRRNQALLMEVPPRPEPTDRRDPEAARRICLEVLADGREWLTEPEAKEVLRCYGIPVVETRVAGSPEEAADLASEMDFPAALKILSPDITHKTDVGGVALGLNNADEVLQEARAMQARVSVASPSASLTGFSVQPMISTAGRFELILGLMDDPIFGPVILFGEGGTAVEIVRDQAVALPPLNMTLARDAIFRTRISRLLGGHRGRPGADVDRIGECMMLIGELAADVPEVAELDINPLLADEHGVVALDARIRVKESQTAQGTDRFAIRPYPTALESKMTDSDGRNYLIRPVKPEDAPLYDDLLQRSDPEDVRMRFLGPLRSIPNQLAARLSQIDYDREMAFLIFSEGPDGKSLLEGGVRMTADPDGARAEYAVMIASDLKGRGLGQRLMTHIIDYARARGIGELYGTVLRENRPMLKLCQRLGFERRPMADDPGLVEVVLPLQEGS